jgi:hypothetical protein
MCANIEFVFVKYKSSGGKTQNMVESSTTNLQHSTIKSPLVYTYQPRMPPSSRRKTGIGIR